MSKYGELLNIPLPKKIKLIIKGDSIDKGLAMEIIQRTDAFFFGKFDNDLEYINEVRELLQLPQIKELKDFNGEILPFHKYEKIRRNIEEIFYKNNGIVKTNYVLNEWICPSKYIASGWCHTDGRIAFSEEIGNWPTVKEILDDFIIISKTFPFLKMDASIIDNNKSLISFKIYDGNVMLIDPNETNLNIEDTEVENEDVIPLEIFKKWVKVYSYNSL